MHFLQSLQPYTFGIVFLLIYLAEHLFPQRASLIDHRHDLKNLGIGLLNLALVFLGGYYFQQWIEWNNAKGFGLFQWLQLPFVLELLLGFLLIDCFLYWWHRINHVFPFLWAFHVLHHRDEKMNSTTGIRFHMMELLLSLVLKSILFPLLGLDLSAFILHGFVLLPVVLFHHSNIRFSLQQDLFLRRFIVTPHMHRIHHSNRRKETDSNYSSILPYWDQLFGTYHKQVPHEIDFGV